MGHQMAYPQVLQFIHQGERVHATEEEVFGGDETYPVGYLPSLRLRDLHLLRYRRGLLFNLSEKGFETIENLPLRSRFFPLSGESDLDKVAGLQGQIDHLLGDGELSLPHLVVDVLDIVCQRGDPIEAEHGTRPLQGMHGPEDPSHDLSVFRSLL